MGVWLIYKDLEKQYVQQSVPMSLVSGTDILMTIVQLGNYLLQGVRPGQFFTDEGASECQD